MSSTDRGPKTHPKLRNTQTKPRLHKLFRTNFCLLPCGTSQEPNGNWSDKLVQMNFFIWGGFSSSEQSDAKALGVPRRSMGLVFLQVCCFPQSPGLANWGAFSWNCPRQNYYHWTENCHIDNSKTVLDVNTYILREQKTVPLVNHAFVTPAIFVIFVVHGVWAAKPLFYRLEREFVIFAVFVEKQKKNLFLAGQRHGLPKAPFLGPDITFSKINSQRLMYCNFGVSSTGQETKHTPCWITLPRK